MAQLNPWLARAIVGILYLKYFLVGAGPRAAAPDSVLWPCLCNVGQEVTPMGVVRAIVGILYPKHFLMGSLVIKGGTVPCLTGVS